jgi:PAS domain S-box-containing protein
MENIYEIMFEDSYISYLRVKVTKTQRRIAVLVKSYNKAYESTFIKNIKNRGKYFIEMPITKEDSNMWISMFDKAKEMKKYTIEHYNKILKEYTSSTIFYAGNDEFYIRIIKLDNQHIKLSQALKTSPCIAWIKDRDGRYIDMNDRLLEILGKKYDEVIGKKDEELVDKNIATGAVYTDNDVLINNKMVKYEFVSDNENGKSAYFDVVKWPYTSSDDTLILGTMGIGIDISENIKTRKKLEETENRFLEIANNSRDIIMVIKGNERLEYVNPAFERAYGFKPDKLYESMQHWYEHWDNIKFEPDIEKINDREPHTVKYKLTKHGQDDRWFWSRFVPILDENGEIEKLIGILSDITKDKKIEDEIEKAKVEFLANLSHELRTPINLMLSAIQLMYLKLEQQKYNDFSECLSIINQNGNRLLRLVNNLIDTTKLEVGCFVNNPVNANIVSYIEDICMSIVPYINANGLEISFDCDEEEKIIGFDPYNMERIILNLLSNAIKFNRINGKIEVSVSCEDDIKIKVKDSGIGIPKEKLESIFIRFEQLKNDSKKEHEGSGIGLSIVKSLVEMQGGTICVNSKLGFGSEFIITLPDIKIENKGIETLNAKYFDNMKIELSDINLKR